MKRKLEDDAEDIKVKTEKTSEENESEPLPSSTVKTETSNPIKTEDKA